jgi:hypothetical protein
LIEALNYKVILIARVLIYALKGIALKSPFVPLCNFGYLISDAKIVLLAHNMLINVFLNIINFINFMLTFDWNKIFAEFHCFLIITILFKP